MDAPHAGCRRWEIPSLTADQMAEVDRVMVDDLRVDLIQMMELAGHHLARLARDRFLGGDPRGRRVLVLAGSGANGGGGLVAARRLLAWCADVTIRLAKPSASFAGVPAHQLHILRRLGAPVREPDAPPGWGAPDLIVDALIGYRLAGAPRGHARELIERANASMTPILSLDLPSGLCATTGAIREPCVRAGATMTLGLPKTGLWKNEAHEVTGELYLADIGIPDAVYTRAGVEPGPIFAKTDLLRIG